MSIVVSIRTSTVDTITVLESSNMSSGQLEAVSSPPCVSPSLFHIQQGQACTLCKQELTLAKYTRHKIDHFNPFLFLRQSPTTYPMLFVNF